jgi:hypothetical protein
VLLLEARSKMNTMGAGVSLHVKNRAGACCEGKFVGLVIGNDDARAYSAGADLGAVVAQVQAGDWKGPRRDGALLPGRCASSCGARRSLSSQRHSGSRSVADANMRYTATAFRRTPSCTLGSSRRGGSHSRRRWQQGVVVPLHAGARAVR